MTGEIKKTLTDVLKALLVVALPLLAAFFFIFKDPMPYILGFVFGVSISYLAFIELAMTLAKAIKMSSGRASIYTGAKYHLRLLIYGIAVFVSIKAPYLDVWATISGILMTKLIIYAINVFGFKKIKRKEE